MDEPQNMLSEKSQMQETTSCMIPLTGHPEKANIQTLKISVFQVLLCK